MNPRLVHLSTRALLQGALLFPPAVRAADSKPATNQPASANGAASLTSSPAAAPVDATGEIVRLEEFKVSTTIGSYAETSTSTATKVPMDMKELAGTLQVLNTAFVGDKLALALEDLYPYVVGMTRESQAAAGFTLRGFTNNATNTLLNNIQFDGQSGGVSR